MENRNDEQLVQYKPVSKLQHRVSQVTNIAAATALAVTVTTAARAADEIDVGTLALTGLGTAAATVFTIKASPSLMMWGYRKILGFIGR